MRDLYLNEPIVTEEYNPFYKMVEKEAYGLFMFENKLREKGDKFHYLYSVESYNGRHKEEIKNNGKYLEKEFTKYFRIIKK